MITYSERFAFNIKLLDDGMTIRKTANCSMKASFVYIEALINHFIRNPDPKVVPVYDFKLLTYENGMHQYQYDMMRLGILSGQEKDLIDRAGDLLDMYGKRAFWQIDGVYSDFDEYPELYAYLKDLIAEGRYYDLHSGNIMMDTDYNYRIIDLEGFLNLPLEKEANDWISRLPNEHE